MAELPRLPNRQLNRHDRALSAYNAELVGWCLPWLVRIVTNASLLKIQEIDVEGDGVPFFRKLSAEEVAAMRARRRGSVDLTDYIDFLRTLDVGEGGEVTLKPDEQKRTVKRRLTRAARQLNKDVRYRRSEGNVIRFEVRTLAG